MAQFLDVLPAGFRPGNLDLDSALDNQVALLKMQADLSGADVLGGFGGYAWGWIPGEGHRLLFNTYGIGASRLVFDADSNQWHFYHREVLYYLDPETGEVLESWVNPYTGRRVEVLHILNDPVNRIYPLSGGPFAPPYEYTLMGDDLVFQIDVLRAEENPLTRREYPLHSQQVLYQSAELWAIRGSLAEINDPEVTSAACHTAWGRISMWLPFMEMGNRPGQMIYHSQSFKLLDGVAGIPPKVLAYTEKHHPQYLEAPREWTGMAANENTWTYSKAIIDERRAAGNARGQSVFGLDP